MTARVIAALAALSATLPASRGEEWNVRADLQIVSLPAAGVPDLIERFRDPHTQEAAANEVAGAIGEGRAELLDWQIIWSANARADVQAGREVISMQPGRGRISFVPFIEKPIRTRAALESHPSADGQSVTLHCQFRWTESKATQNYRLPPMHTGLLPILTQPLFKTFSLTASVDVQVGRRVLLGAYYGSTPEDPVTLFIVRAATFASHLPSSK